MLSLNSKRIQFRFAWNVRSNTFFSLNILLVCRKCIYLSHFFFSRKEMLGSDRRNTSLFCSDFQRPCHRRQPHQSNGLACSSIGTHKESQCTCATFRFGVCVLRLRQIDIDLYYFFPIYLDRCRSFERSNIRYLAEQAWQ